jgi:hypothetical protein
MWLYGVKASIPIYYDTSTFLWSKKTPKHNPIAIEINNGTIKMNITDTTNSWLNPSNQFCIMGRIHKDKLNNGTVEALTYILEKNYVQQNMLFITWDYENWCFRIISPD